MTVLPFRTAPEVTAAVAPVARHLGAGRLLAYPTETVYGLGSRSVERDVRELVRLKGRKEGKPFLLLIAHRRMAEAHGLRFNEAANAMAETYWPGPLTLVLPGGEGKLPDRLRGPEGGIAVRWTGHRGMARLIDELGEPITSTSANQPGGPTAPGVEAIQAAFADAVREGLLLILDGGALGNVPPSTVIDCTGPVPRLIREGAIPRAELRRRLGRSAP